MAAGYMLASNYTALGQKRMARYALIGSVVVVLTFIFLPTQFATNVTSAIILMIAQVVVVLAIANKLQGQMFASFEEMGGKYHSMGRAVLVGVLASLVLTVVWVMFWIPFLPLHIAMWMWELAFSCSVVYLLSVARGSSVTYRWVT